jgi:NAD(P)-dependent dehydrogenase (short-subunit alcohol dehydrogenase family)
MRLAGKVAVITGGGSGIGAAICRTFAAEGAAVAVTDIDRAAAEAVAAGIRAADGAVEAWAFDVADAAGVENAAGEIEARLGPIAIWVNNAGVSFVVPFLECTRATWELTQRVNLTGAFVGCQAAVRRMLPRRQGAILNMSSQSGRQGNSHYAAYCASKFGIIGLTQSLAVEFASQGIRVNALCPGVVFTPLWDGMMADYAAKRKMAPEAVRPYLESKIPLGRLCTPEDVARAAVFLASDESAYITGQALNVNGGGVMS